MSLALAICFPRSQMQMSDDRSRFRIYDLLPSAEREAVGVEPATGYLHAHRVFPIRIAVKEGIELRSFDRHSMGRSAVHTNTEFDGRRRSRDKMHLRCVEMQSDDAGVRE